MINASYHVTFDLRVEQLKRVFSLTAEIEEHHSEKYFIVKNIARRENPVHVVLPEIRIKKMGTGWVHCDSEKETELSIAVGKAIDTHEQR